MAHGGRRPPDAANLLDSVIQPVFSNPLLKPETRQRCVEYPTAPS